jgi:hypothetical protein
MDRDNEQGSRGAAGVVVLALTFVIGVLYWVQRKICA